MPLTPGGLPYPSPTDAPDVPADLQALAEAVDDLFDTAGEWASYTPVLTAVTTSPVLGSGATAVGRYCRVGNLVVGFFNVTFGGSGVSAGSGNYLISLPTNARQPTSGTPIGRARVNDASASVTGYFDLMVQTDGSPQSFIRYQATWPTGTLTTVNQATPFAWAASDQIVGWFAYEAV